MARNIQMAIKLSLILHFPPGFLAPSSRQSGPVSGTYSFESDNLTGADGLQSLTGKVGHQGNRKKTFEKGDQ